MNSILISNIIEDATQHQQVFHQSSVVSSPIEFYSSEICSESPDITVKGKAIRGLHETETFNGLVKTKNYDQKKNFGKAEIFNGQIKAKTPDQNKTFEKEEVCNGLIKSKNYDQKENVGKEDIFNGLTKSKNCGQNERSGKVEIFNGQIKAENCNQTKSFGKEEIFNGHNKSKNSDQNKNSIENPYLSINKNNEKSSDDTMPVPKIHLYTGKISVDWNQMYKIGAGLNNMGNTCFMNTVLQCLTYCPPLANYLLQDNDHASKCSITGFCMMCILQKHIRRVIGKSGEIIKPVDVFQRLRSIAKHFQFGRQEDAHEFLRYVIDNLWKSCLPQTNGITKLDSASKETTVINKIFGGYHRSQVICLRCKKASNTFDHFMDFMLDIKQNVMTLEKALEKFTQPELLQHENSYKCPKCKIKVEAQKRFSVYRAPTVATFQLKRFDCNRSFGGKITKQISYPEKLNLRPYMSDPKEEPVWYRLNAVLVHAGASCNSGHYYCYVKNSNDHWYIMDDQTVHQVSLTQVLSQSAYVLFYIQIQNPERAVLKKSLDKSCVAKGMLSNSHFSKDSRMHDLKSEAKWSVFSNTKSNVSYENIKKFGISNQNRDKISFTLQVNDSSAPLSSTKNRASSSEPASAKHGGLVPYVEDSSESSDAADSSSLSLNKKTSISGTDVTNKSKCGYLEGGLSKPPIIIKAKRSKFFQSKVSCNSTTVSKLSATGSWIVTEVPKTSSSSISTSSTNTSGVTSTTDWQVIVPTDNKRKAGKDYSSGKEPCGTPKAESLTTMHLANNNDLPSSSTKKSNGCESSSSRLTPVHKKAKYSENFSFLKEEKDVRNSGLHGANSSGTSGQYSSHCDNNSRTCIANGISNSTDSFRASSSRNTIAYKGTLEKSKNGKSENSISSSKPLQYEKGTSLYNQGKKLSLYGTEVPTWRGENQYRPSTTSALEHRRSFDDYNTELDRGRGRKFFQHFPQKQADRYGKHGKFHSNHQNYRKYDSQRGWKSSQNMYKRKMNERFHDRFGIHHRRF